MVSCFAIQIPVHSCYQAPNLPVRGGSAVATDHSLERLGFSPSQQAIMTTSKTAFGSDYLVDSNNPFYFIYSISWLFPLLCIPKIPPISKVPQIFHPKFQQIIRIINPQRVFELKKHRKTQQTHFQTPMHPPGTFFPAETVFAVRHWPFGFRVFTQWTH